MPAEQIELSYDLAMMALADYLSREQDAATTIDRFTRILDLPWLLRNDCRPPGAGHARVSSKSMTW
jgi:hypothetical protein